MTIKGGWEMDFWEKVKKDIQKGIQEGIGKVREGVVAFKEKAEELTEEGKRRLKIFELKAKVQREFAELGGRVYDLSSKVKNPMIHNKIKTVIARIKKLEMQIAKLEDEKKETYKKVIKKPSANKKKKKSSEK